MDGGETTVGLVGGRERADGGVVGDVVRGGVDWTRGGHEARLTCEAARAEGEA